MVKLSLKLQAAHGILWITLGSMTSQIIQFLIKIVLARLLTPSDFGLLAIALIFTNIFAIFLNLGIGDAIIIRPYKNFLGTAFVLLGGVGIVSTILVLALAPFAAWFFNEPQLWTVLSVLSPILIFSALNTIIAALLQKHLKFKQRVIAETGSVFAYGMIAAVLAWSGFGIWSLVAGQIGQTLVQFTTGWFYARPRAKLEFNFVKAKELLQFGKPILVNSLASWMILYIDNFAIGKILNTQKLGLYSLAFSIISYPITITHLLNGVLYPIYSKYKEDRIFLKQIFKKGMSVMLLVISPMAVGIFVMAEHIVRVLFSEQWIGMIPVLKILSFYIILRGVASTTVFLLLSIEKQKTPMKIQLFEFLLLTVLIFPATYKYGLAGAAFAVLFARFTAFCFYLSQIKKQLEYNLQDFLGSAVPLAIAFIMGFAVYLLRKAFFSETTLLNLLTLCILGVLLYAGGVRLLQKEIWNDCKQFYSAIMKRSGNKLF